MVATRYPVVVERKDRHSIGVTVPDIPGCHTTGDTLEDAMAQAALAIEQRLNILALQGVTIPPPGSINGYRDNPRYALAEWRYVDARFPCRF